MKEYKVIYVGRRPLLMTSGIYYYGTYYSNELRDFIEFTEIMLNIYAQNGWIVKNTFPLDDSFNSNDDFPLNDKKMCIIFERSCEEPIEKGVVKTQHN